MWAGRASGKASGVYPSGKKIASRDDTSQDLGPKKRLSLIPLSVNADGNDLRVHHSTQNTPYLERRRQDIDTQQLA